MLAQILQELSTFRKEVLLLRIDNADLKVENTQLNIEISKLKIKKNSNNSSLPLSQDIARKNKSLREHSGKYAGGQIV